MSIQHSDAAVFKLIEYVLGMPYSKELLMEIMDKTGRPARPAGTYPTTRDLCHGRINLFVDPEGVIASIQIEQAKRYEFSNNEIFGAIKYVIGMQYSDEILRSVQTRTGRPARPHGARYLSTKDYVPSRINLNLGDDEVIIDITFG